MPSSNSLPRPDEWPAQDGRRYVAAFVFVTILGTALIPVGVGFAAIGKAGAVKYALLLAAFFLLIAAYTFVTRIRPQHRETDIALTTHSGSPATEIRYSQAQFVIIVALVTCMAAVFTFAAVDYAFAADNAAASPVAATLCGLAAAFFLSFLLLVLLGRLRRGRILLSEQGIHQEGRAFTSFLPWDAFVGVKPAHNGLMAEVLVVASANAPWERRQHGSVWKLDKLPPVPMIEIDTTVIAVDRNLIYHLVRYYVENPSARPELGTQASVQRAREAQFT